MPIERLAADDETTGMFLRNPIDWYHDRRIYARRTEGRKTKKKKNPYVLEEECFPKKDLINKGKGIFMDRNREAFWENDRPW